LPENDRSRSAATPSDVPARGWKDILIRVYEGVSEDRILANGAAVTFYALLAIFPGIAALVSIYGLFADPTTIASNLDTVSDIMPGGAVEVIRDQVNRIAAEGSAKLGISFLIGLTISLWSANGGMKALLDALNAIYEEEEKRSLIILNAISLLFTIGAIFLLMVALAGVLAVPIILGYLPEFAGDVLSLARWPVLLVVATALLALIYRYGPSRATPRWRWVTWGSAFAALTWLAASAIFSWYAANFGTFNKTYGSLGSCPRWWCKSAGSHQVSGGAGRFCHAATAGNLTRGSSLKGAMVSRVM